MKADMPQFTIGSVPYVNAAPLVWGLEHDPDRRVQVVYDIPSRLPGLLESDKASAILVSSVDALIQEGRCIADRVCIGSRGPVRSVRLFSKTPPSQIRSLALDRSSMTSNRLALLILAEAYGSEPEAEPCPPHLASMLESHDAAVLIGDTGMTASGDGLHVLDLGEEWVRLTGLPFVWAVWAGGDGLTPELSSLLAESLDRAEAAPGQMVDWVVNRWRWERPVVESYLFDTMTYRMDDSMTAGYREFQRLLLAHGLLEAERFPRLV